MVTFQAIGDTSEARLDIPSTDPDTPVAAVGLLGAATAPALEIASGSHEFGEVGLECDATQTFTLRSVGTGTLWLGGVSLEGSGFSLGESLVVDVLEPDEPTTVSVRFMPDEQARYSTLLIVDSNDPRGPQSARRRGRRGIVRRGRHAVVP